MADKLLVRAYNVELGDCVYCRIPKARKVGGLVDDFHILIDCGSVGAMIHLKAALTDLQTMLPDAGGGKRRLDLLVVTHEHKDHIAGFDPALFVNIKMQNVRNYQTALGNQASALPKFNEFEKQWLTEPQPLRTDCENALSNATFVDVEIEE